MRTFEAALKAVGDPTRTRMLKLLEDRELCVCQLQAALGLAPSTVSRHLALLRAAGLVEDRREGKWIHYRLCETASNPYATGVLALLRGTLDREPRIVADRRRLKEIVRIPLSKLCDFVPAAELSPKVERARRPRARRVHA